MTRRPGLGLIAAILFGACAPAAAQTETLTLFKIASGNLGGTYYPVASMIAQVISNPPGSKGCGSGGNCGVPGLAATAISTDGSIGNVEDMRLGVYPSAIVQSDVAYWAYSGSGPFRKRNPNTELCSITSLYPEEMHLVRAAESSIGNLADLAGKRVALGKPDSGALLGAQLLLRAHGMSEIKDFLPVYVDYHDARQALTRGTIDALLTITGAPNPSIAELSKKKSIQIVPITGDARDKLIKLAPFYSVATIPANSYIGQNTPVDTVAVFALWIARTSVDQTLIHDITKAFWQNKFNRKILDSGHPKGKSITLRTAFNALSIPLCPGADKFYREAGMLK